MSDELGQGYIERRAFQRLENMGSGQDAASKSTFDTTAVEEHDGVFSKVGRNPESGVAVKD